jgi:hypothetical protein
MKEVAGARCRQTTPGHPVFPGEQDTRPSPPDRRHPGTPLRRRRHGDSGSGLMLCSWTRFPAEYATGGGDYLSAGSRQPITKKRKSIFPRRGQVQHDIYDGRLGEPAPLERLTIDRSGMFLVFPVENGSPGQSVRVRHPRACHRAVVSESPQVSIKPFPLVPLAGKS